MNTSALTEHLEQHKTDVIELMVALLERGEEISPQLVSMLADAEMALSAVARSEI